jgi:anthranilate 1,2-dioxygenase small subunit
MQDLMLRLELQAFLDRYIHVIDNDLLEEWPKLFTEDCLYEIIPKENEEAGLPAPVMYCDNNRMLRDRVLSLRHANIFEKPSYRHLLSALHVTKIDEDVYEMSSNYVVVNTSLAGESSIYQAGRYADRVVRTEEGLRFKSKRVIYDTLRVQTLLAYPI